MIVSISGAIGSGKDTLARHLIENHGFVKGSFSAAPKDAVAAIFGWDRDLLDGTTDEGRAWREQVDPWWTDKLDIGVDITPRWVLINFATEVMRGHFHQDIWMLAAERWLNNHGTDRVVFTDTRFLNEFTLLQNKRATILGVYRKIPKWLNSFYVAIDAHLRDEERIGLMEIDMTRASNQSRVLATAKIVMRRQGIKLHDSEMQHLLWNKYTGHIDNTGKLDKSIEQLMTLVKV